MTIKDKLVECIARNIAKERYGNSNKKDEFLIESEMLLKTLILQVLVEKSHGDPYNYIECLENFAEICDWDYYDIEYVESLVFGN